MVTERSKIRLGRKTPCCDRVWIVDGTGGGLVGRGGGLRRGGGALGSGEEGPEREEEAGVWAGLGDAGPGCGDVGGSAGRAWPRESRPCRGEIASGRRRRSL